MLRALPHVLVQDSWLALVSGREVAERGIPRTDGLTAWTQGVAWVDQQWLAQLAFYSTHTAGGMRLLMLFHAATLVVTLTLAFVAARSLGASAKSVSLVAVIALSMAPWALQLRAQALAMPLFVCVLWLLAADSRAPSRRVLLVLPLLVVWANIHGSVTLGAALVALRGLTLACSRGEGPKRLRAAGLLGLPFVTVLVSPYTTDLIGYYRTMLGSPLLRELVVEWGPSTPSGLTALFYLGAFGTVALLARHRGRLSGFEQLALLVTLLAGLTAIRSIVWFGLTALLLVPRLAEGALSQSRPPRPGSGRAAALIVSAVVLAGAFAAVATRPTEWFTSPWPHTGGAALAQLLDDRPDAVVVADERTADWLLWEHPPLRGRVAYDVRFELLTPGQMEAVAAYRRVSGTHWDDAAKTASFVAYDPREQLAEHQHAVRASGFEELYRDSRFVIAARPAAAPGPRG